MKKPLKGTRSSRKKKKKVRLGMKAFQMSCSSDKKGYLENKGQGREGYRAETEFFQ